MILLNRPMMTDEEFAKEITAIRKAGDAMLASHAKRVEFLRSVGVPVRAVRKSRRPRKSGGK